MPIEPFDPDQLTKSQRADIKRRQGCTPEQYARAFVDQNGRCACCGGDPTYPSRHLRMDTTRRDGRLVLICQSCFDVLHTLANRSQKFLDYLESSLKQK